jgi:hypothetical protein
MKKKTTNKNEFLLRLREVEGERLVLPGGVLKYVHTYTNSIEVQLEKELLNPTTQLYKVKRDAEGKTIPKTCPFFQLFLEDKDGTIYRIQTATRIENTKEVANKTGNKFWHPTDSLIRGLHSEADLSLSHKGAIETNEDIRAHMLDLFQYAKGYYYTFKEVDGFLRLVYTRRTPAPNPESDGSLECFDDSNDL